MSRDLSLDLIRLLACLMVIMMHAPMPAELTAATPTSAFLTTLTYLTEPCIGLFFMVSGALLLPVKAEYNAFSFLRKRLGKVVAPTLVWTAFYMVVNVLGGGDLQLKTILSIPFCRQGHGVLWFMYTLVGLYLLAPLVSPFLARASRKELELYLSLWCVTLFFPLLRLWLEVDEQTTGALYYFTGFAGYFLLGHYLQRYGERIGWGVAAVAMAFGVVLPNLFKLAHVEMDYGSVFWYLSPSVMSMCVFWWVVLKKLSLKLHFSAKAVRGLSLLSSLSFGVYLVHIFLMRRVFYHFPMVAEMSSYISQTIVIILLTAVASFLVSALFSLTPLGSYLIGFRYRKR